jgi:hypothetical protein
MDQVVVVVVFVFCLVWGLVCLSKELVSALWFEDTSFFNEQVLDTPVGRFSVRQMCFFLVFGLLAYVVSCVFGDLVLKVVFGGVVFCVGATIALWRVRTLPLEVHLLYLFKRRFLQHKRVSKVKVRRSVPSTVVVLVGVLGVPVRVLGVLRDSASGNVLSAKPFVLLVVGTAYSSGVTDGEGFFSSCFVSDRLGQFHLSIVPEGSTEPFQKFLVNVNLASKENNIVEEVKPNELKP